MTTFDPITSAQNPKVQLARALLEQPKARRKHQAFAVEGARLLEDGLNSAYNPQFILYKASHSARVDELLNQLDRSLPVYLLEDRLFDSLADTESSQGIMGIFDHKTLPIPQQPDFIVIPDQLRDPGNLGTILRSAEAAGVQTVCLPPGTADAWAPKVLRAGMGAHFRLPIFSWDWVAISALVEGMSVFHADMQGEISCWQADFTRRTALLIGGEAEGISEQAQTLASQSVRIPMLGQNESLNAAISASILMFEVLRQRMLRR